MKIYTVGALSSDLPKHIIKVQINFKILLITNTERKKVSVKQSNA